MMIIFHLELLECKGCLNPLNSHLPWTWDQDFNCWNYPFYVNSRPYLHLEVLSIPQNSLIVALIIVLVNENLDTVGDIKKKKYWWKNNCFHFLLFRTVVQCVMSVCLLSSKLKCTFHLSNLNLSYLYIFVQLLNLSNFWELFKA